MQNRSEFTPENHFGYQVLKAIQTPITLEKLPNAFKDAEGYFSYWRSIILAEATYNDVNAHAPKVSIQCIDIQCQPHSYLIHNLHRFTITLTTEEKIETFSNNSLIKFNLKNKTSTFVFIERGNRYAPYEITVITLRDLTKLSITGVEFVRPLTPFKRMFDATYAGLEPAFLPSLLTGRPNNSFYTQQELEEKKLDIAELTAGLNEKQADIVKTFTSLKAGIMGVNGLPGTGKSQTILSLVEAAIKMNYQHIKVSGPSNLSVQALALQLRKKFPHLKIGYLPSLEKISQLPHELLTCTAPQQLKELENDAEHGNNLGMNDFDQAQVFIMTDSMAGSKLALDITCKADDWVVFYDEAGQGLEPNTYIVAQKAKIIVLVGDPKQLKPTILNQAVREQGADCSLLGRIQDFSTRSLTTIYRGPLPLFSFNSMRFYRNTMEVAKHLQQDEKINLTAAERASPLFTRIHSLIDIPGEESKSLTRSSFANENQGNAVIALLTYLKEKLKTPIETDVLILSPYQEHIALLQKKLPFDVPVKSIDGSQGSERRIVILCTVRGNKEGSSGFLAEENRLNVATTRAQGALFVICDVDTVLRSPYQHTLTEFVKFHFQQGSLFSENQFRLMLDDKDPGKNIFKITLPYEESLPRLIRQAQIGIPRAQDEHLALLLECKNIAERRHHSDFIKNAAYHLAASLCRAQKNYPQALTYYHKVVITPQIAAEKAYAHYQVGDEKNIQAAIQLLTKKCKREARNFKLLALCYEADGSFQQALLAHEEAIKLAEQHPAYLTSKARCYLIMQDYAQAYASLKKLYDDHGVNHLKIGYLLMRCCIKIGRLNEADKIFKEAQYRGMGHFHQEYWAMHIEYLIARGHAETAIQVLEKQCEKNTIQFAFTYHHLKRYDQAIAYYREALQQNPTDPQLIRKFIECYLDMHQPTQALQALAAMKVKMTPEMECLKADCLMMKRYYAEAREIYQKLLKMHPLNAHLKLHVLTHFNQVATEEDDEFIQQALEELNQASPNTPLYSVKLNHFLLQTNQAAALTAEVSTTYISREQRRALIFQYKMLNDQEAVDKLIESILTTTEEDLCDKVDYLLRDNRGGEALALCEEYADHYPQLKMREGIIRCKRTANRALGIDILQDYLQAFPYSFEAGLAFIQALKKNKKKPAENHLTTVWHLLKMLPDDYLLQLTGIKWLLSIKDPRATPAMYQVLAQRFAHIPHVIREIDRSKQKIERMATLTEQKEEKSIAIIPNNGSPILFKIAETLFNTVLNPLRTQAAVTKKPLLFHGSYLTVQILQARYQKEYPLNDLDCITELTVAEVKAALSNFKCHEIKFMLIPDTTSLRVTLNRKKHGVSYLDITCCEPDKMPTPGAFQFNAVTAQVTADGYMKIDNTAMMRSHLYTIIPPPNQDRPNPAEKVSPESFSKNPMLFIQALKGLSRIKDARLAPSCQLKEEAKNTLPHLPEDSRERLLEAIRIQLTKPGAAHFFKLMHQHQITLIYGKHINFERFLPFIMHVLENFSLKESFIPVELLLAFPEIFSSDQDTIDPQILARYCSKKRSHTIDLFKIDRDLAFLKVVYDDFSADQHASCVSGEKTAPAATGKAKKKSRKKLETIEHSDINKFFDDLIKQFSGELFVKFVSHCEKNGIALRNLLEKSNEHYRELFFNQLSKLEDLVHGHVLIRKNHCLSFDILADHLRTLDYWERLMILVHKSINLPSVLRQLRRIISYGMSRYAQRDVTHPKEEQKLIGDLESLLSTLYNDFVRKEGTLSAFLKGYESILYFENILLDLSRSAFPAAESKETPNFIPALDPIKLTGLSLMKRMIEENATQVSDKEYAFANYYLAHSSHLLIPKKPETAAQEKLSRGMHTSYHVAFLKKTAALFADEKISSANSLNIIMGTLQVIRDFFEKLRDVYNYAMSPSNDLISAEQLLKQHADFFHATHAFFHDKASLSLFDNRDLRKYLFLFYIQLGQVMERKFKNPIEEQAAAKSLAKLWSQKELPVGSDLIELLRHTEIIRNALDRKLPEIIPLATSHAIFFQPAPLKTAPDAIKTSSPGAWITHK